MNHESPEKPIALPADYDSESGYLVDAHGNWYAQFEALTGTHIAKVLNEYPSLEQRLEVATKALERWKCTRCLGMSEWLKQGCPVCKGTGLNSIASTALSRIKGEAA